MLLVEQEELAPLMSLFHAQPPKAFPLEALPSCVFPHQYLKPVISSAAQIRSHSGLQAAT